MRSRPTKPPPVIAQDRVIEYAILPKSIPFAGDKSLFVAKKGGPLLPLARVPNLAICKEDAGGFRLAFCDGRWRPVASTTHPSVAEAKRRAERIYPGALRSWTKARVSVAAAKQYLEQVWGPHRCMFCLRTPLEHDGSVISMGQGRICSSCVLEFAADLATKEPGA